MLLLCTSWYAYIHSSIYKRQNPIIAQPKHDNNCLRVGETYNAAKAVLGDMWIILKVFCTVIVVLPGVKFVP